MVKERPILFSATMVRAILAGKKTQTRRVVKVPRRGAFVLLGDDERDDGGPWWPYQSDDGESSTLDDGSERRMPCPYGKAGTRLWVRETWRERVPDQDGRTLDYRADHTDDDPCGIPWRPSIHMPRWASRITLEITDVRVERLQDISEADAMAEGLLRGSVDEVLSMAEAMGHRESRPAACAYRVLWEDINGPGSWDANPWVWVVTFQRVEVAR